VAGDAANSTGCVPRLALHGFSHPDCLKDFGAKARSEICEKSSLDLAMRDASRKTRRFLMTAKGLSEDEAISLMSVAVDFGVTQVVDGNWGVHAVIRKVRFDDERFVERRSC
jgi:acetamidase/formamidase